MGINPLLVILFTNFSRSIDCVFILLMVSFAVQKLLSLIKFYLFNFAFISFALWDRFPPNCNNICQRVFHLCFSLGVLWHPVLHLGFRSLIHSAFIFVYDVWIYTNFILLHVAVQFCQHHSLKRLFLHCLFLSPFSQIN